MILRRTFLTLFVVIPSVVAGSARGDEPATNFDTIRLMSRDQRALLSKNLEEFDALDANQKTAIRDLDQRLSEVEPETRARYIAVLRRYHVFLANLPEPTRKTLEAQTDPAEKLKMIAAIRAEQAAKASANPSPFADAFQISELSRVRLRALAKELVVWFSLDPKADSKDRSEFGRLSDASKRRAFARSLIQRRKLNAKIQEEQEDFREASASVGNEHAKVVLEQAKTEAFKRKGAQPDPATKTDRAREFAVMRLDEIQVIRTLESETVSPENLERFEAALPAWARESMDALPPDAARRRIKILYRLVFPTGTEMPLPKVPEKTKANARPAAPPSKGAPSEF